MRRAMLLIGLLVGTACASTEREEAPPPVATGTREEASRPAFPPRPDLARVLERAEQVPILEAARLAVAREEGSREQASLLPDPVLTISQRNEPDDFADGRQRRKIAIRERIETAGKRDLRIRVAEGRRKETVADERTVRIRVARAAARAHQRVLLSATLAEIRREALSATEDLLALEEALLGAGRTEETALVPLRARVGTLRVALAWEESRGRTALRELEGLLALAPGTLAGVEGDLLLDADLPEGGGDLLDGNPEIQALAAAEGTAAAALSDARAGAWPDVTVGLEYEDMRERRGDRVDTLGLMLEVPIPVFDRNQGDVRAARAEVRRTEASTRDARARLAAEYEAALEVIRASRENRQTYLSVILPARERELELTEAAHAAGRSDRKALLAARIAVAAARAELAAIEGEIALLVPDVLAILGRPPEQWIQKEGTP